MNATKLPFNTVRNFVLPHDLSFVLTNFLWLNEISKKNRLLFKRIIARYAMKFHANFLANYRRKITGTKNEIRAFNLHYFCTVLYSLEIVITHLSCTCLVPVTVIKYLLVIINTKIPTFKTLSEISPAINCIKLNFIVT